MAGFVSRTTALVAVGLVGVSGCSRGSQSGDSVSASDLQKAIVAKLAEAGTPTTWVTCGKDLAGRVGATTRCDVTFDQANAVTALLTTTQVRGGEVSWEITRPMMTKDQVTRRVAGMSLAEVVNCNSGLDGNVGSWAQCEVTKGGTTMNQALEVKAVHGFALDIAATLSVSKQLAEDLLRNKLMGNGQPPESATCPGDLVGGAGTTMDCVATAVGGPLTYTLSVSDPGTGAVKIELAGQPPLAVVPEPVPVQAAPAPAPVWSAPAPAPVWSAPVPPVWSAPAPPVWAAPAPEPVWVAPAPPPRKVVPSAPPVEGVPHLPPVVPHLPPGGAPNPPGPMAPPADAVQVVAQASTG